MEKSSLCLSNTVVKQVVSITLSHSNLNCVDNVESKRVAKVQAAHTSICCIDLVFWEGGLVQCSRGKGAIGFSKPLPLYSLFYGQL